MKIIFLCLNGKPDQLIQYNYVTSWIYDTKIIMKKSWVHFIINIYSLNYNYKCYFHKIKKIKLSEIDISNIFKYKILLIENKNEPFIEISYNGYLKFFLTEFESGKFSMKNLIDLI